MRMYRCDKCGINHPRRDASKINGNIQTLYTITKHTDGTVDRNIYGTINIETNSIISTVFLKSMEVK